MTFLAKIQESEFKNPELKEMLTVLETHRDLFKKNNRQTTLDGIVVGLADTFQDDAELIAKVYDTSKPVTRRIVVMEEVNLGGGTTDGYPCDDCEKNKTTFTLTDAKNRDEVREYFIGGIGNDKGCEKMVSLLKTNGIKYFKGKSKDAAYLAGKVFEMITDETHVLSL